MAGTPATADRTDAHSRAWRGELPSGRYGVAARENERVGTKNDSAESFSVRGTGAPLSDAPPIRPFGLSSFEAQEVDLVIAATQKLVPIGSLDHDGRRNSLELESRLIDLIPPNTMS
jgi:hypothetical protein